MILGSSVDKTGDSATSIETRSTDTPASLATTTTARSAANTTSNPSKNKHVCNEIAIYRVKVSHSTVSQEKLFMSDSNTISCNLTLL